MSLKKILNYKLFKNKKEDTKSSFNIKELKDDIRDILLDITDLGYNYNLNFHHNSMITILIGYDVEEKLPKITRTRYTTSTIRKKCNCFLVVFSI